MSNADKPAFPGSYTGNNGMPVWSDGMTLRDYFAAKADLSKFEVNSTSDAEFLVGRPMPDRSATGYQQVKWQADLVAAIRYMMADAMLAAREQEVRA
jgi:hypothetical protein